MTGVFHHIYFMPWIGFFTKLEYTDYFVVLDNVGFRRNHIKRVKILNAQGSEYWLCIPVGNNWGVNCNTILMPDEIKYKRKFLQTLITSYGKSEYFNEIFPAIEQILKEAFEEKYLVDCNIKIVDSIRNLLDLKPIKIVKSSALTSSTERTKRIIEISNQMNIDKIIMGGGKMEQVHDLEKIENEKITLYQQDNFDEIPEYVQVQRIRNDLEFKNGLSIVDVLFNIGKQNTREIIQSNAFTPKIYQYERV